MDPQNGVLSPDHVFVEAKKQVKSFEDMPVWEKSEAYQVHNFSCSFEEQKIK